MPLHLNFPSFSPVRAALVLGASVLALRPGEASACSCAEPFANELRVGDGRIPSNAAGVTWWFPTHTSLGPLESLVKLERWDGEQLRVVAAVIEPSEGVYLIRPAAPWSEGERYRISVDAGPSVIAGPSNLPPAGPSNVPPEERFRAVEFEVAQPLEGGAPLTLTPSSEQRRKLVLLDRGGACAAERDVAVVDVYANSATSALPQSILFFETYVDGRLWQPKEALCQAIEPGTSWLGRGRDRLVADCTDHGESTPAARSADVALPIGAHSVRIDARLPGTDVVFSTGERWVGLFCRGDSENALGAESETVAPGTDVAGGSTDSPRESISGGGCALSAASRPEPRHGAFTLFALVSLAAARWRRSRRSSR